MQNRKKIREFIIDETLLKVSNKYVWVWVAIEPMDSTILGIRISIERTMLVAERFLQELIRKYGKQSISTDGGTWYPQACRFLELQHHLHSSHEKSIIERTIQYIKDRTECFDDYFPCRKHGCKLEHVINWLNLFVDMHNKMILEMNSKWTEPYKPRKPLFIIKYRPRVTHQMLKYGLAETADKIGEDSENILMQA